MGIWDNGYWKRLRRKEGYFFEPRFSSSAICFFATWLHPHIKLLANKHAVGSLLEFLKDTDVGSREGTTERAAE